jgi:patatin-like phospholipase/acyl hydrolase
MITAFDLSSQQPRFFKTWDTRENFYTRDVVLSTSAAPSYFKPRQVHPVGQTPATHIGYVLSDGGTFANDPNTCLLADAIRRYPDATRIEVLSLGTGIVYRPVMYKDVAHQGLLYWGRHAINTFMLGQAGKCHYIVDALFNSAIEGSYSYWNPIIDPENSHLDNTSERNIDALIRAEDNMIHARQHEFSALVHTLMAPKDTLHPVNTYGMMGS